MRGRLTFSEGVGSRLGVGLRLGGLPVLHGGSRGRKGDGMRRYLVVANQTLGGDHLAARIQTYLEAGPCHFHLVVPATPSGDHLTWTLGEARAVAQRRLDQALAQFRALGAEVTGIVGDRSPMLAIRDALRSAEFEAIVLSTLPPGVSRWLHQDLPRRIRRSFGLPVDHLVVDEASLVA